MFSPGETIVHSFIIPFKMQDVSKVVISYKARDDIFFEKVITPTNAIYSNYFSIIDNNHVLVKYVLDQEESLLFPEDLKYQIQLNVITYGGSRHASEFINNKEYFQHIHDVISGLYESENSSIVKEAYYAVFGNTN